MEYLGDKLMLAKIYLVSGEGAEGALGDDFKWLDNIMSLLIFLAQSIGGIFLIYGIISWALAYRSQDSNAMTNAVKEMIAGGLLLIAGSLVNFIMG